MIRRTQFAAAAALVLFAAMAASPATASMELRTSKILQVEQLSGPAAWKPGFCGRLARATWRFDGDGTFSLQLPDVGVSPISGIFRTDGGTIAFRGGASWATSASTIATVDVEGNIEFRVGTAFLHLNYSSCEVVAPLVDRTHSGRSRVNAYRVEAVLDYRTASTLQ